MLYALRMFCANSIVPGTSVMPNGSRAILEDHFGRIGGLLDKAHRLEVLDRINGVVAFYDYAREVSSCYEVKYLEIYRRASGLTKRAFWTHLQRLFRVLGVTPMDEVEGYYVVQDLEQRPTLEELVSGLSEREQAAIKEYLRRFATRRHIDTGRIPVTGNVVQAVEEIKRMLNEGVYFFSGKKYPVEKKRLIAYLDKVANYDHLDRLSNNNYLKAALRSQGPKEVHEDKPRRIEAADYSPAEGY